VILAGRAIAILVTVALVPADEDELGLLACPEPGELHAAATSTAMPAAAAEPHFLPRRIRSLTGRSLLLLFDGVRCAGSSGPHSARQEFGPATESASAVRRLSGM
jgi:hypothetical protein